MNDANTVRLDKWLWAARFFKTRKLAGQAITGGKVHVNGQRTKPGKEIKIGTRIEISKDRYSWHISVKAISAQRRPAKEAILLYEETIESKSNREELVKKRQQEKALFGDDNQKPNKKERRLIHRFKRN